MIETLIQACISFLKIGAFSFGGGYAVVAFIQREIIENHGWISGEDFVNIVAIAEMTPGPIAVNSSTFVGYTLAGILGGICAVGWNKLNIKIYMLKRILAGSGLRTNRIFNVKLTKELLGFVADAV